MEEIWKYIEGYPNYMVSNMGRVKSIDRKDGRGWNIKGKILKQTKLKQGYLTVALSMNGIRKGIYIHRLVASAFIPNLYNLPQVNHKDEDKTNNRVDNLEWCDAKYNSNYGSRNNKVSKSRTKPILQFRLNGEFVRKWDSATQVKRELGFYQSNIQSCCKGKIKSAYNYKWGYAKDYERIPFKVFDLEIYEKKVA